MQRHTALFTIAFLLTASIATAELQAGAAVADITPPIGGRMAGYGDRLFAVSEGVHDPLTARALVLTDGEDSAAIVTLDLIGYPKEHVAKVKEGVRARTGIAEVTLFSSHTHSGPEHDPEWPSKEKPWIDETTQKLIDLVATAQSTLAPVTYGAGKGETREGHNRRKVAPDGSVTMFWRNEAREPTSPVDYEVGVIQFNTLDGKPLATLVNFTCHPVVLGPKNLLFSADYPGVMRRVVENEVGGTCLFANGACGDINPFMDKSDPAEGAFDEVEKMGTTLGKEVVRVVKALTMHEGGGDLTAGTETIAIPMRWDLEAPEVLEVLYKKYSKFMVNAYLKSFDLPMVGDVVTITLGDDVAIVGLPGEFFVEHGLHLKAQSAIPNTFAFGYCNNTLAYFPTINGAWQGGYGGREATLVAVGAGEQLVNTALVNLYYQTGRLRRIPEF
jgi:neutral ceramidase